MKRLFAFSLVLIGITTFCFAQDNIISGTVYAFKDLQLENILVTAKKAKTSVTTDFSGAFTISCENRDKLIFSGNGFKNEVIRVNKDNSFKIKMVFEGGKKNEKDAIDSNHVSKEELLYSIEKYSEYNNNYSNYNDIYSLIQGEFSGIQFVDRGNGSKNIIIGGISSLEQSNTALLIVDGIIVDDISNIQTIYVKTAEILRNGTRYGSRGSNGVVIITTKQ